jgi:hypothetical protein
MNFLLNYLNSLYRHNFGMEHDTDDCKCPDDRCIMSSSSSAIAPTHWSSCSIDQLNLAFHHGMDYCLKNKPTKIFDSPICGNGFVEAGEQCGMCYTLECALNRRLKLNFERFLASPLQIADCHSIAKTIPAAIHTHVNSTPMQHVRPEAAAT